jgi:DNA-binding NarL/FixJ family response regulator
MVRCSFPAFIVGSPTASFRFGIVMIRVLIVDDHPVVRSGYARLLETGGDIHIVAEAADAESGFDAYIAHSPSVTVTDLSMPGSSGIELIRRIHARTPSARLLVFSVHDETLVIEKALQSGASGFISKRSAPEVLLEAVRAVARGERYLSSDVRKVFEHRSPSTERAIINELSPREFEVFRLLAQGLSAAECAACAEPQSEDHRQLPDTHQGEAGRKHIRRAGSHGAAAGRGFARRTKGRTERSRENIPAIGIFSRLLPAGFAIVRGAANAPSDSEHPDWRLHNDPRGEDT